jgi:hypothetical protein
MFFVGGLSYLDQKNISVSRQLLHSIQETLSIVRQSETFSVLVDLEVLVDR